MLVLTPSERRLAALVATLLALGAVHDLLPGHPPGWRPSIAPAPPDSASGVAGAPAGAGAPADSSAAPMPSDPNRDGPAPVDLNSATAAQLDALPGIGPVLARRIVDHRARYGPFRDPRDIRAVTGIGPKLYARIQPYVRVGTETPVGRR